MNAYLTTTGIAVAAVSHVGTPGTATVTLTSTGTTIRVHAAPQPPTVTKVVTASPSPNVNIISTKRSRIVGKDKDVKKVTAILVPGDASCSSALQRKDISLEADLRNMMHAFGDSCNPLDESIRMMESVLKQELQGFVCVCDSIAAISGAKSLGLQEPINAIRNERSRLIRLLKYFAIKDQQLKLQRMNQISQGVVSTPKLYLEEIRIILEKLDESGEYTRLLESEYIIEATKSEKALRADKIYQRISYPKYFTYSKARSVSFARKIGNLQDWVATNTRSEFKMSNSFMEVLSFLAYEIVSQMVDLAFIVRREHVPSTNPIYRLTDNRAMNPETCMSSPAFQKRKDDPCNSVSEILVQASELEAKRLKKVTTPNKEIQLSKNMFALTPSEIGEAYNRFQRCVLPAISYKVRAEKLRRLNYQY